MTDRRWLAYMLATTYHECAAKMWPIREYGQGKGHDYGVPDPETGETYYRRAASSGLTWKANYDKAGAALGLIDDRDLVWHPDIALDSLDRQPGHVPRHERGLVHRPQPLRSISTTTPTTRSTPARSSTATTRTR